MAFFGSDWLEEYDSLADYETHIGGIDWEEDIIDYYTPIFPPIHIEDDDDSLAEYESGIKHFKD